MAVSSEKREELKIAEVAAIMPPKWSRYALEIYMKREPPVLGTVDWLKLEGKARETLKEYPGAQASSPNRSYHS